MAEKRKSDDLSSDKKKLEDAIAAEQQKLKEL